jgi:hypothetical protein
VPIDIFQWPRGRGSVVTDPVPSNLLCAPFLFAAGAAMATLRLTAVLLAAVGAKGSDDGQSHDVRAIPFPRHP